MNSNAAGNHHRAIFAVAAWFSISARAQDIPTFQPRFLNHPVRRLQSFCPMESTGLSTARANLEEDLVAARNACTTPPCFIDVADTEGYNDLLEACEAARGAFHVGSVDITCSATYEVVNMPECFESASQDATCTTDVFEDYIAIVWDFDECTEVATHTNTTDFSGSSTSSCLVDSSIVDTAGRILATEVLADANACTNSPCVFNVETYPEYSAMVDACESATGVFHVFSVVVTCVSRTLQFNDYPDCFISESLDPDCTESFSETYMEKTITTHGLIVLRSLLPLKAFRLCSARGSPMLSQQTPSFPRRECCHVVSFVFVYFVACAFLSSYFSGYSAPPTVPFLALSRKFLIVLLICAKGP
jgi:hypothetical protein